MTKKAMILEKLNISTQDFLGSGMEAEVYSYEKDKVLKLYNDISDVNKQTLLKKFYSEIDSSYLSYELPYIHDIFEDNGILVTIEKRIQGSNMQSLFSKMNFNEQNKMMETYLNTNLELKSVKVKSKMEGFILFNNNQIPLLKVDNWYSLLKEMIISKQMELEPYFKRDVLDYNSKVNQILEFLSWGYEGEYSLIHGDFYPGNLLIENSGKVTGLIDFGMMTMYGDNLFDIAMGLVCFDMYDELKANIYERYLNIIISTLGENVRKRLYLYVLVYSFITANFYSENCEDGHYQWCCKNLNNKHYWEIL
jgi:thiamine kinase-like enzyme